MRLPGIWPEDDVELDLEALVRIEDAHVGGRLVGIGRVGGLKVDDDGAFPLVLDLEKLEKLHLHVIRVHGDGGAGILIRRVNDELVAAADRALLQLIPRRREGVGDRRDEHRGREEAEPPGTERSKSPGEDGLQRGRQP